MLAQDSIDEMEKVLRDLLVPSELADVANQLQIFSLLDHGVPQRQIADQLGVGITTVMRCPNALKQRKG